MPESEMPGTARGQEGEEVMEGGRELDEKVAELVMGWKKHADCLPWVLPDKSTETYAHKFSTEWYAMRLVVERMRELEYFIEMVVRVRSYLVCMKRIGGTPMRYYAEGESLPYAVCLASLAAIEGERK